MLTRIVKLTLEADKLTDFLNHFDSVKEEINSFPGCLGMQLLLDKKHKGVVLTHSKWENEAALNHYRDSELFGEIWPTVKKWFSDRPQAWSTELYFDGFTDEK